MSTSSRYQKCDPVDHVLLRPDTYVGDTAVGPRLNQFVVREGSLEHRESILMSPALERVFVEILSNALDNIPRSKELNVPMTTIKVWIDPDGETRIWNDGASIPVEKHDIEQIYIGTLIFGHLLTGDNYDDSKERSGSGRNGYGAKLTNIMSNQFDVESCDVHPRKDGYLRKFHQVWAGNMKKTEGPNLTMMKGTQPYTQVTWTPDPVVFGNGYYDEDTLGQLHRLVYDAAMIAGTDGVDVYLNDEQVPISNLKDYAKLFGATDVIEMRSKDSHVVLTPSDTGWDTVAFTNGVYNSEGGVHVDEWSDAIFRPLLLKFNKKGRPQLAIRDIKQFFRLFVSCRLPNPRFASQSKMKLAYPKPVTKVEKKHISVVTKWDIAGAINDLIASKEILALKKTERKKKGFKRIDGYDPANNSSGGKSNECILILTEGLSAKTYAVRGIQVGVLGKKGRDWIGIFPLRGKLLNVRNAKPEKIASNITITNIIHAVNLRYGVDYTKNENFKTLKYGKIIMLCDADTDGFHIEGLLINAFRRLFPTLFEREKPFLLSMGTPAVRVFTKPHTLFYSERAYEAFLEQEPGRNNIRKKYHKGLGTSNNSEVRETFGRKITSMVMDDLGDQKLGLVFDEKLADRRKQWLLKGPPDVALDDPMELPGSSDMTITDFVNKKMINFSLEDCERSIPHVLDGLKQSQRKILYAVFLKKINFKSQCLKVAQLSGFVAEKTGYHHGEGNLEDTIKKMADDVIGLSNIPLLFRDGQFGTRLSGGKDAAAGRYVNTKMDRLTRLLFPEVDDSLLPQQTDDGSVIEPEFYLPIVPTILINGCRGIGTGWSSTVPLYSPRDVISACEAWIDGGDDNVPEIHPWYRGFTGKITELENGRYMTTGVIAREKGFVKITELPIGMWTDDFKEFLEELLEKKMIRSMKNHCTPKKVRFEIKELPNGIKCTIANLKLCKPISTGNMVTFVQKGKIRKMKSAKSILCFFARCRLNLYVTRRLTQIASLNERLGIAQDKLLFLELVMTDKVVIRRRPEEDIEVDLLSNGLSKRGKSNSFDYLLNMSIRSQTQANMEKLAKEIESLKMHLDRVEKSTPGGTWKEELAKFREEYEIWEKTMSLDK